MNAKYAIFIGSAFEIVGLLWLSNYLSDLWATNGQEKSIYFLVLAMGSLILWSVQIIFLAKKLDSDSNNSD